MSLVYNNKKLIGKCSKYAIEKVQGTSPFVMLENFEPKQPQLNENQQKWINRLTINYSWYGGTAQHALHATLQEPEMPDLPQNEFAQVLEVFSKWVQEQEEE